jgi:large subunit ribosomal protein L28
MMICDICGKGKVMGSSQHHRRGVAGKRWMSRVTATPRLFVPNLQNKTVMVNGEKKKMKLCAKCIKRIKKYKAIKNYKNIAVV